MTNKYNECVKSDQLKGRNAFNESARKCLSKTRTIFKELDEDRSRTRFNIYQQSIKNQNNVDFKEQSSVNETISFIDALDEQFKKWNEDPFKSLKKN